MVLIGKKQKPEAAGFGAKCTRSNITHANLPSFIRTIPSTPELHRVMRRLALVGYTTDRELGRLALTLPRRKYLIVVQQMG
jgi:hypothetical protein